MFISLLLACVVCLLMKLRVHTKHPIPPSVSHSLTLTLRSSSQEQVPGWSSFRPRDLAKADTYSCMQHGRARHSTAQHIKRFSQENHTLHRKAPSAVCVALCYGAVWCGVVCAL